MRVAINSAKTRNSCSSGARSRKSMKFRGFIRRMPWHRGSSAAEMRSVYASRSFGACSSGACSSRTAVLFCAIKERRSFTAAPLILLTDSYHGIIFSLLFSCSFVSFKRFHDTDPICQNIRITSLLEKLGLLSTIIEEKSFAQEDLVQIDFNHIQDLLSVMRKDSSDYITNTLRKLQSWKLHPIIAPDVVPVRLLVLKSAFPWRKTGWPKKNR